jgi:hypothetical protein
MPRRSSVYAVEPAGNEGAASWWWTPAWSGFACHRAGSQSIAGDPTSGAPPWARVRGYDVERLGEARLEYDVHLGDEPTERRPL